MTITISAMAEPDWPAVAAIYQEGIDTGNATFTPAPPTSWEEWQRGKLAACSLVAREEDAVVGWAALSSTSTRAVYAGVAESASTSRRRRGAWGGSALLQALIATSRRRRLDVAGRHLPRK
jgi:phosphinothricin acetyltransferase